jgi:hypothetical protein
MLFHGKDEEMPLIRKTRISTRSIIIITLPHQIVDAYDITSSDFFKVVPLQQGEILMKNVEEERMQ